MAAPQEIEADSLSLPIGYRFMPTDEELCREYLRPKVFGYQKWPDVIPKIDLPKDNPTQLEEKAYYGGDGNFYFYTKNHHRTLNPQRKSNGNGMISGFWEATGISVSITDEKGMTIGTKIEFIYHSDNDNTWIMYFYQLSERPSNEQQQQQQQQWVLAKLGNKQLIEQFKQQVSHEQSDDEMDDYDESLESFDDEAPQEL